MNNSRSRYITTRGYQDHWEKAHMDLTYREVHYEDAMSIGLAYGYYCLDFSYHSGFSCIGDTPGWWINDR